MLYTILDLETTGLRKEKTLKGPRFKDDIIEVGYIQINENAEIVRSGQFYFYKDEFDIENDAQKIHGLTREYLRQFEGEFMDGLVSLYTLMEDGNIIGKNSDGFDIPFTKDFMERHAPQLAFTIKSSIDMQKIFTPLYKNWYKKKYGKPTVAKGKLGELMEVIGYTDDQVREGFHRDVPDSNRDAAHGALYDVYMTYLLVKYADEQGYINLKRDPNMTDEEILMEDVKLGFNNLAINISEFSNQLLFLFDALERLNDVSPRAHGNYDGYSKFFAWLDDKEGFEELLSTARREGSMMVTENRGILFYISDVAYWMLESYVVTMDERYLLLMQYLYKFVGWGIDANTMPEKVFDMTLSSSKTRVYMQYVAHNEAVFGVNPPVDFNDMKYVEMYQRSAQEFWKAVIPNANRLLRDIAFNRISDKKESVYGVMSLIYERGGLY